VILGNALFSCGRSSFCGAVSVAVKLRLGGGSGGGGVIDDGTGGLVAGVEVLVARCILHKLGEKGFVWL